ncbi:MAG: DmsE family decaheme c-type cytochrome [Deltaproteobacteria bacterium]|nr:DmsE family decaheme c-type cytochrome [Deltaproteobacteria bacterium]
MDERQQAKLFVYLGFLLFILCVCALAACKTGEMGSKIFPVIPGATYVGDQACLDCHEDSHPGLMASYKGSIHGALADFETLGRKKGCESCHGLGSVHAESGSPADILNLKKIGPEAAAEICLECHKTGGPMKWRGGEHAMNDVSCVDCHQMHKTRSATASKEINAPTSAWERHAVRSPSLKKAEPDLCYDCHENIQVRFNYPSHHPVREGKMICSDCHEPHGGPGNLKTEGMAAQDVCFNCHARYQGPFAYEHEAVIEGCGNCHEPHGAVVDNLLKKTEPFLCLQCHRVHSPIQAVGNLTQTVGNRCSYCHPEVHGSNVTPHLGLK